MDNIHHHQPLEESKTKHSETYNSSTPFTMANMENGENKSQSGGREPSPPPSLMFSMERHMEQRLQRERGHLATSQSFFTKSLCVQSFMLTHTHTHTVCVRVFLTATPVIETVNLPPPKNVHTNCNPPTLWTSTQSTSEDGELSESKCTRSLKCHSHRGRADRCLTGLGQGLVAVMIRKE